MKPMTVGEWAKYIGIGRSTAYRKIAAGEINVADLGTPDRRRLRITPEAHEQYMAARQIRART